MNQNAPQDYTKENANSHAKRTKWGIRGRIAAAFIIISIITLVTGVIAALSYDRIDENMKNIEEKGIRITARAFSITKHTAEAAKDYNALLAATDMETFTKNRDLFQKELNDLGTELAALKISVTDMSAPPDLYHLEQSIAALSSTVEPIIAALERKITLTSEIDQLHDRTDDAYNELIAELTPIFRRPKFRIAHGTETVSQQRKYPTSK